MSIKHCRIINTLIALIVGGAIILAPTISASQDTSLDDKLTSIAASSNVAATTLPVFWSAGGLSAGNDSAGQAARIVTDISGNIAIVSGPAFARSLAVTSYTAAGTLRWQRTVDPISGKFAGAWIEAAPNGDFVAVGRNVDSHGSPFGVARDPAVRTLPRLPRLREPQRHTPTPVYHRTRRTGIGCAPITQSVILSIRILPQQKR